MTYLHLDDSKRSLQYRQVPCVFLCVLACRAGGGELTRPYNQHSNNKNITGGQKYAYPKLTDLEGTYMYVFSCGRSRGGQKRVAPPHGEQGAMPPPATRRRRGQLLLMCILALTLSTTVRVLVICLKKFH